MDLRESLRAAAVRRENLHLRRHRHEQNGRDGSIADIDGRPLLNFSSNDYLGFAQHPAVCAAFRDAAMEFGVGSAGSALVSGYFRPHRELEARAAALFGYEAALYTGSGYLANLAVLTTGNPDIEADQALFAKLGIIGMPITERSGTVHADVLCRDDSCAA